MLNFNQPRFEKLATVSDVFTVAAVFFKGNIQCEDSIHEGHAFHVLTCWTEDIYNLHADYSTRWMVVPVLDDAHSDMVCISGIITAIAWNGGFYDDKNAAKIFFEPDIKSLDRDEYKLFMIGYKYAINYMKVCNSNIIPAYWDLFDSWWEEYNNIEILQKDLTEDEVSLLKLKKYKLLDSLEKMHKLDSFIESLSVTKNKKSGALYSSFSFMDKPYWFYVIELNVFNPLPDGIDIPIIECIGYDSQVFTRSDKPILFSQGFKSPNGIMAVSEEYLKKQIYLSLWKIMENQDVWEPA